jgi:hypothetical protein
MEENQYFYIGLVTLKITLNMKKVFLLATAALLVTGATFADGGKKNKKKCAKSKTCCTKDMKAKGGCCKDKAAKAEATTATL